MKACVALLIALVSVSTFAQARTKARTVKVNQGFTRSFCLSQPNATYRIERGVMPEDVVGMCYCGPAELNLIFGTNVNVTKCEKISEAPACYRAKAFLTYFSTDDRDILNVQQGCVQ